MSKYRFTDEEDILDQGFRKWVIKEIIDSQENRDRKNTALRKHEVFRDLVKKWVVHSLLREGYEPETVAVIENRIPNLSITRRIVKKLASTYTGGVTRTAENTADQESLDTLAQLTELNKKMREWDQYETLHHNTLMSILPVRDYFESDAAMADRYRLKLQPMAPWQYDVIEDPQDRTKARVVILTEFHERTGNYTDITKGAEGLRSGVVAKFDGGDGTDQVIADSPSDRGKDKREFIWWSDKYHFTTDAKGKIIAAPEKNLNPVQLLPFVNNSRNQDGSFWAEGGSDLADGGVHLCKLLGDMNFIQYMQGWGQMYVWGRDIPKKLKGGPNNAFIFEMKDGDPQPGVAYATSNPNVAEWLESIRAQLALLLSTNNLSSRLISMDLTVQNAASGVSMIVESSETTSEHQERQADYQHLEPEVLRRIKAWHDLYSETGELTEEFTKVIPLSSYKETIKFHQVKQQTSEKEKLDEIEQRQKLGINTEEELLKIDNPNLSDEEAAAKVMELKKRKADAAPVDQGNDKPSDSSSSPDEGEGTIDDETRADQVEDNKV